METSAFGWWSLLPPVLAILLAIVTRRVLISLLAGIAIGCGMLAWGQGIGSPAQFLQWSADSLTLLCDKYIWHAVTGDNSRLRVLAFVVFMGAMVGVIYRAGGMHGIVNLLAPLASTRRRGQMMTWILGLIIFFDDYANTLLLGNTMRPVTDRLKISREKLAYLVDSTAAPVAGLAIISTWVATLITYVDAGFQQDSVTLDKDTVNSFLIVVQSIPYRFYVVYAILFVPLLAWTGRDFMAMRRAERRALMGKGIGADLSSEAEAVDEAAVAEAARQRWYNAVVPIGVMVAMTVLLIITTGINGAKTDDVPANVINIFGKSDSYLALVYASLSGLLAAALLALAQRVLTLKQIQDAAFAGTKKVIPAMGILCLAWGLSDITQEDGLGTGQFLAGLLTMQQQPDWMSAQAFEVFKDLTAIQWMPTMIYIVAAFVAFATGTSWGTMGMLTPLVVGVMYQLITKELGSCPPDHPLMLAAIGSVLAGAIFGDHCSPISDTTVLSSQASSCNHVAHVRTQLPYALVVAAVSIVFGTLPVGWAIVNQNMYYAVWIVLAMGIFVMWAVVMLLGRNPEPKGTTGQT